ncbi:uncharacterized protein LOC128541256 [Clarias gariepinus]|uniref:uncharacterized protein LOC128541256 n=1 Tax=Clarias gariepinus TaxID=13013 RepID=UPI00234C5D72|nr:uncharacterized protein LOC128541256 [Clarias gariepinus]
MVIVSRLYLSCLDCAIPEVQFKNPYFDSRPRSKVTSGLIKSKCYIVVARTYGESVFSGIFRFCASWQNKMDANIANANASGAVQADLAVANNVLEDVDDAFVTRRNPTAEITSLISSLYISDRHDDDDDDDDVGSDINVVHTLQTELNQCKEDMGALTDKVNTLEQDFRQSVNSSLNRETSFRDAVDASLEGLERYCQEALEKLERAVTDCFLRRDVIWENQMKKLRLTSTPTIQRLKAYTPASPQSPVLHSPSTAITASTAKLTSSVSPSSSSFYGRPPIRLEFPAFGDASETADVLNFIEQCENYLEIRPLPSPELLGTLSTVLRGPALSWWKAEKGKVKDWKSFKQAFMAAFLPDDYLTEVEENLRSLKFVMADGKTHQAQTQRRLSYNWHTIECELDTYVMSNSHLAFPLIVGLDFLKATGATLDVARGEYGLKTEEGVTYHPFIMSQPHSAPSKPAQRSHSHLPATANLYLALPVTPDDLLCAEENTKTKEPVFSSMSVLSSLPVFSSIGPQCRLRHVRGPQWRIHHVAEPQWRLRLIGEPQWESQYSQSLSAGPRFHRELLSGSPGLEDDPVLHRSTGLKDDPVLTLLPGLQERSSVASATQLQVQAAAASVAWLRRGPQCRLRHVRGPQWRIHHVAEPQWRLRLIGEPQWESQYSQSLSAGPRFHRELLSGSPGLEDDPVLHRSTGLKDDPVLTLLPGLQERSSVASATQLQVQAAAASVAWLRRQSSLVWI